jgi:porin
MIDGWTGPLIGGPIVLIIVAVAGLTVPDSARADCDVTNTGIPDNAVAPIDVAGMRKSLAESGIGFGGYYNAETFGNPSGGIKQGVTYDGVLELHVNGDMKKLGFWKGLCFYANGYQIHGHSIAAENVGSLATVSNLEATPATRLYELWLEQSMFNEHVWVRFGQLAADGDFFVIKGGDYVLNGWGWPSITSLDLPSGGPGYPLATPGVRVILNPNDKFGLKIGVYNGDPAGPHCKGDPQVCDNNGLEFRIGDPPLLMAEASYQYNQDRGELPGAIKLGGWNHFGNFADERFDAAGLPIGVTGIPGKVIHNNFGLYVDIDQMVWQVPGSRDPKGVGLVGRVFVAPSDRNLVDFYADGGVIFTGMIPNRPDDALGIALVYTGISNRVHAFDLDSGLPGARTFEMLFEMCYTMQLRSGWTLQPDFQYIVHPGGNVPNAAGTEAVGNATVFGIRTTINF